MKEDELERLPITRFLDPPLLEVAEADELVMV
jgi:hypothetical protein